MERGALYTRIIYLYRTLEMTIPLISGMLRSHQPDLALINELIIFQLDAYHEIRLLLEQYAGPASESLEKYDVLLHQLKTDYILITCGISRANAA